jgi:hypothetical protein
MNLGAEFEGSWAVLMAWGLGAVVSAVVAIAVTWLAHRYASRREASRTRREADGARKALQREKLEALVASVDEWVGAREGYVTRIASYGFRRVPGRSPPQFERTGGPSALDRAAAIAELYFPELDADIKQLHQATLLHTEYTNGELVLLRDHPDTWLRDHAVGFTQRGAEASKALTQARARIARHARQLLIERLLP